MICGEIANEIRQTLMIFMKKVVVVEGSAFHVVGRIEVEERAGWKVVTDLRDELGGIRVREMNSMPVECYTFDSFNQLRLVIASINLPSITLAQPTNNTAV